MTEPSDTLTRNFGEPKSRARHERETNAQLAKAFDCGGRDNYAACGKIDRDFPEIREVVMTGCGLNVNLMKRLVKLPRDQVLLALDAIKAGGHPRDVVNYYISQNPDVYRAEQKKRKIKIDPVDPEDAARTLRDAWLKGYVTEEYLKELASKLHWFCSGEE